MKWEDILPELCTCRCCPFNPRVLSWEDQLTHGRQEQAYESASTMGNMIHLEKKGFLFGLFMIFCFHYVPIKQTCLAC